MTLDAFPITSRYYGLTTATVTRGTRTIVFLRRRLVPSPERFELLEEYTVEAGDRLDNLSARFDGP